MIGRVVSTKMTKTATVLVERQATHPLYKKSFKQSKKYLVDDQIGVSSGDIVQIEKCKPISRRKHFKIVKVIGRNLAEIAEAQLKEKAQEAIAEVMPEERSENSENSDNRKVRKSDISDNQKHRSADSSGTPSSSESSERKKARKKKESK